MICPGARVAIAFIALAACNCSAGSKGEGEGDVDDSGPSGADMSDLAFDVPLLEVAIDLEPEHWNALRQQRKTRHASYGSGDCLAEPVSNPYTWFPAIVAIDGDRLGTVGLRKKGQFGSQSTLRPSLKLAFDKYASGQSWRSLDRLALNNSKQDPSYARTCVTYDVFRKAGIPAPRCTMARVTVNGVELGVYNAVEEIDKEFLRRNFADPGGNLYEGTASDFRPDFVGSFEQETNLSGDASRADLVAVLGALQDNDGPQLIAALDQVIDVDAFVRFWAVESLVWHRDGYSGNANNFFIYADPSDGGRFHFLPWGADGTFTQDNRPRVPDSVLALSALTQGIYQTKAGRDRYHHELAVMLDQVWQPDELVAETERIAELVGPLLADADSRTQLDQASTAMIETIRGRRAAIDAALADGQPAWTEPLRQPPCRIPVGPIAGTFTTTWDSLGQDAFIAGAGSLDTTMAGESVAIESIGSRAGRVPTGPRVQLLATTADNRRLSVVANFPPDARWFEPHLTEGEHPLLWPPMVMSLTEFGPDNEVLGQFEIGEGTFTFDSAGTQPGEAVAGSFQGMLYKVPQP